MVAAVGPNVQVPGARSDWFTDSAGMPCAISVDAMQFFHIAQQIALGVTRSGPTGARPTAAIQGRWIGMPFYDTTIGKPVYLVSIGPDVWKDAAGNVV
jgi:hypothetical protein